MATRQSSRLAFSAERKIFTVPYETWPDLSKAAYEASTQAYNYDNDLYATNEALRNTVLFRSTDKLRSDFYVNKYNDRFKFVYNSKYSTDQMATYTHENVIIFAFRGTDYDPMRFLGFLPTTYAQKCLDYMHTNIEGTRGLNLKEALETLPYSNIEERCPCDIGTCNPDPRTREDVIEKITKTYCSIPDSIGRIFSGTKPRVPEPEETKFAGKIDTSFKGGNTAEKYSDCYADVLIAYDSRPSLSTLHVFDDKKHKAAFNNALQIYNLIKHDDTKVLFTGHSLGGALAYYAYQNFLLHGIDKVPQENKVESSYFVGFNAATLANYYQNLDSLKRFPKLNVPYSWKQNVLAYRNYKDLVSGGATGRSFYGKNVPTINYTRLHDAKKGSQAYTDSLTHGLWTFKKCHMNFNVDNNPNRDFGHGIQLKSEFVSARSTVQSTVSRSRSRKSASSALRSASRSRPRSRSRVDTFYRPSVNHSDYVNRRPITHAVSSLFN